MITARASVLIALLAAPLLATAGEFLALPGLWKTTVQGLGEGGTAGQPEVRWHCVDEVDDAWRAYAQIELPPGELCRQTRSERTGTTLEWTVECKGPLALVSSGRIVFDSGSHYQGQVQVSGDFMGYPLRDRIRVEGQRYAACTSPRD